MMDRILAEVEADPYQRQLLDASQTPAQSTTADAICAAMNTVAGLLPVAVIVTYTTSGSTSIRAARERPQPPILSMTPKLETARHLALVWGVHSVQTPDVSHVSEMVENACRFRRHGGIREARRHDSDQRRYAFRHAGATNLLRIATV
jgi:pyruvate kinase